MHNTRDKRNHLNAANFPGGGWEFKGVSCGTLGEFPQGADLGVGFEGKAPADVIGYSSAALSGAGEQEL